jgi:Zn finger protein HypA/HybF involved in hydrogenase expression
MKKLMLVAVAVVAMGVYAEEAPKADAKAAAPAADAKVVCAECAKLNKDLKAGEQAKLCPACQKKADEAKKAAEAK